jgi:type IV pilus assembly protein PilO
VLVKDYYAELPIAVKVSGRYHDIGAFAADVSNLSRIVTLHNLIVLAPPARRGAQHGGDGAHLPLPGSTEVAEQKRATNKAEARNERSLIPAFAVVAAGRLRQ